MAALSSPAPPPAGAVQTNQLSTTYLIGLGIEATITIALGLVLFGEHLTRSASAAPS